MERESFIAAAVMGAVIAVRLWLWAKFRQNWRGKRIMVSTAQLLVVIATVITFQYFGQEHGVLILVLGVLAVVCISFVPIRPDSTDAQ
jgi:hypothetical protein